MNSLVLEFYMLGHDQEEMDRIFNGVWSAELNWQRYLAGAMSENQIVSTLRGNVLHEDWTSQIGMRCYVISQRITLRKSKYLIRAMWVIAILRSNASGYDANAHTFACF